MDDGAVRIEGPPGALWGKTPASQRRRQEIVLAAKQVFFEDGYQRASMDRIAEVARTTKRTVYDHFGSKDALFAAVIDFGCQVFVEGLPKPAELSTDIAQALTAFTSGLGAMITTPDSIRFQRMVIAEAERHPEFARRLYDAAFLAPERVLGAYLTAQIAAGRLAKHDVGTPTRMFVDLATASGRTRALLAVKDEEEEKRSSAALKDMIATYLGLSRRGT